MTVISPDEIPNSSGRSITKLRPSSSTVTVKSVPRIPILDVGVSIEIFSLLIAPILPVMKRAVPLANFIDICDLLGFGSKITLSIISLLCSVNLTTESSKNVMPTRPLAV